jgi:hypothetical protein
MALQQASFSSECRIGRLVEARLKWLATAADVQDFLRAMLAAFTVAGPRAVICADWRQVSILPPEASDALIGLLRQGNRHFARSAVLLSPGDATLSLQVERLVRDAGNSERRTFRASGPMLAWLGEVLTPHESRRASEFIEQPPSDSRA